MLAFAPPARSFVGRVDRIGDEGSQLRWKGGSGRIAEVPVNCTSRTPCYDSCTAADRRPPPSDGKSMAQKVRTPRLAWALTGSGHFVTETLALMRRAADLDLFVSKAASEVVRMYRDDMDRLPKSARIFKDTTASAAPV